MPAGTLAPTPAHAVAEEVGGAEHGAHGYMWAGCVALGSAVGFALSQVWGYGVGMPIGGALGAGAAFLLIALRKR